MQEADFAQRPPESQVAIQLQSVAEHRPSLRNDHQVHVSPALRLCPELLAEIFLECLPRLGYLQLRAKKPPLLLCQICSAWREVAISTPRLWSSIHTNDSPSKLPLIQTWLARSGNLPLSISVEIPLRTKSDVLDTFLGCAHRWQNISLSASGDTSFDALDGVLGSGFQRLETFTGRGLSGTGGTRLFQSLESAPRLHSFSWRPGGRFNALEILRLPWTQLTHLHLYLQTSICDCLRILSECSRLVDFSFHVVEVISPILPGLPIVQNTLRSLSVTASRDLDILFGGVILSALQNLSVFIHSNCPWPTFAFSRLICRPGLHLKKFTLEIQVMLEDELISCLESVPSLADLYLNISNLCISDRIFSLLTYDGTKDQPTCLVPKLERIRLGNCSAVSGKAIAQLMQSRWWKRESIPAEFVPPVARLKVVELLPRDCCDGSDVLPVLEKCREEGLDLPQL